MNQNQRKLSISFKFLNWKSLILLMIAVFYLVQLGIYFGNGRFPITYGEDFFAFWSIGKIADTSGYSQIYDLNLLKETQLNELDNQGLLNEKTVSSYSPIPVPIFTFFVPVLQLLSKLGSDQSFWVWTASNIMIFTAYLWFFIRKTCHFMKGNAGQRWVLILAVLSFPFFVTIGTGQINVFLMLCMGEFIRNAFEKKPIVSGLWLGGLLLKPQLLVLIVPLLLIYRYWKVIWGFAASFAVIFTASLLLGGIAGMKALISLWFKYSAGLPTNAINYMINWRMVGERIDTFLPAIYGWVVTTVGIVITLVLVFLLARHKPEFGSREWVLVMLGIFSATTVITWHSHYHMSLVLVPVLVFASLYQLLPQRYFYLWVVVTPLLMIGTLMLTISFQAVANLQVSEYQAEINAFVGLGLNLMLLVSSIRKLRKFSFEGGTPSENNLS